MSRPSKTVKGAIIGGVIAVFVHLAIGFAIRNWMFLLFLYVLGSILTSCGS